jgi:hypothetical protein
MNGLPNAASTVYAKVFPFTISHCAEIKSPNPARKQRFAINSVWFATPRKPIIESERVIRVVAKLPNPRGL